VDPAFQSAILTCPRCRRSGLHTGFSWRKATPPEVEAILYRMQGEWLNQIIQRVP
jgi:hypothetical protein